MILLSAEYEVKLLLLSCLLAISCEKFTNEAVIQMLQSNEMNEIMSFDNVHSLLIIILCMPVIHSQSQQSQQGSK